MFEAARSGCSEEVDDAAVPAGVESSDALQALSEAAAGDDSLLAALKSTYKRAKTERGLGPRQRTENPKPRSIATRDRGHVKVSNVRRTQNLAAMPHVLEIT